jgi:hypothetical protein
MHTSSSSLCIAISSGFDLMVVYDMLQLHVATMRKAKRAGSPENPISSDPLFGLLLPYCAATEINLVNSAMTQDRRHQLTMLSDDMISPPRLTTQLDLLLDNTGLDIVIPITLNLDGIPLDGPSIQTLHKRADLVSRVEIEPLLQTRGLDGGERAGDGRSDQETQGGDGVVVVGEVLASDNCE